MRSKEKVSPNNNSVQSVRDVANPLNSGGSTDAGQETQEILSLRNVDGVKYGKMHFKSKRTVGDDPRYLKLPHDAPIGLLHKYKKKFANGLMTAAANTSAWIIDGGTHAGVMQLMGETKASHHVDTPLIGIATWGCLKNRGPLHKRDHSKHRNKLEREFNKLDDDKSGTLQIEELQDILKSGKIKLSDKEQEDRLEEFRSLHDTDGDGEISKEEFVEAMDKGALYDNEDDDKESKGVPGAYLDPNHTHYICVDTGKYNSAEPKAPQYWGGEIPMRSNLEDAVCTASTAGAAGEERTRTVPLVVFCFGGGPGTLDTVYEAVRKSFPIIVVQGSGRLARVIEAYYQDLPDKEKILKDLFSNKQKEALEHMKEIIETGELYFYSLQDHTHHQLLQQQQNFHTHSFHTHSHGDPRHTAQTNASGDLLFIIIEALLQNKKLSNNSKLLLAIKWNRPEAVRKLLEQESILKGKTEMRLFPELLAYAAYHDYGDVASALIGHGYDKTIIDALIKIEFRKRSFGLKGPGGGGGGGAHGAAEAAGRNSRGTPRAFSRRGSSGLGIKRRLGKRSIRSSSVSSTGGGSDRGLGDEEDEENLDRVELMSEVTREYLKMSKEGDTAWHHLVQTKNGDTDLSAVSSFGSVYDWREMHRIQVALEQGEAALRKEHAKERDFYAQIQRSLPALAGARLGERARGGEGGGGGEAAFGAKEKRDRSAYEKRQLSRAMHYSLKKAYVDWFGRKGYGGEHSAQHGYRGGSVGGMKPELREALDDSRELCSLLDRLLRWQVREPANQELYEKVEQLIQTPRDKTLQEQCARLLDTLTYNEDILGLGAHSTLHESAEYKQSEARPAEKRGSTNGVGVGMALKASAMAGSNGGGSDSDGGSASEDGGSPEGRKLSKNKRKSSSSPAELSSPQESGEGEEKEDDSSYDEKIFETQSLSAVDRKKMLLRNKVSGGGKGKPLSSSDSATRGGVAGGTGSGGHKRGSSVQKHKRRSYTASAVMHIMKGQRYSQAAAKPELAASSLAHRRAAEERNEYRPMHDLHQIFWAIVTDRHKLAVRLWENMKESDHPVAGALLASYTYRERAKYQTLEQNLMLKYAARYDEMAVGVVTQISKQQYAEWFLQEIVFDDERARHQEQLRQQEMHADGDESPAPALAATTPGSDARARPLKKLSTIGANLDLDESRTSMSEKIMKSMSENDWKKQHIFGRALCLIGGRKHRVTHLDLALAANNKPLLGATYVQNFLDRIYYGGRTSSSFMRLIFHMRNRSPYFKYALHLLSFVVFLGLYAALVLKRPPSTSDSDQCTGITCVNARMDELCTFDALDIVFWVFVCGYVVLEYRQRRNFHSWYRYFITDGNSIDLLYLFVFLLALVLKLVAATLPNDEPDADWGGTEMGLKQSILQFKHFVFAVNAIPLAYRLINMGKLHRRFGVLFIITKEIFYKDIFVFVPFGLIVVAMFEVTFTAFTWSIDRPHGHVDEAQEPMNRYTQLLWHMLAGMDGYPYEDLYWEEIARVFLFFYMLVVMILLLNLLIAQMATTFSNINANSDEEWKLVRASMIREYYLKDILPPPLNLPDFVGSGVIGCVRYALGSDRRPGALRSRKPGLSRSCCCGGGGRGRQQSQGKKHSTTDSGAAAVELTTYSAGTDDAPAASLGGMGRRPSAWKLNDDEGEQGEGGGRRCSPFACFGWARGGRQSSKSQEESVDYTKWDDNLNQKKQLELQFEVHAAMNRYLNNKTHAVNMNMMNIGQHYEARRQ